MKKLLYILLAITILLTLGTCIGNEETTQSETASEASTLETEQKENKSEKETLTTTTTKAPTTTTKAPTTTTKAPTTTTKAPTTTTKAPTTTTKAPVQEPTTEIVYTTATGKKYHSKKSCPGLSRAKEIYESTLSEAKSAGLGPCSKCH